MTLGGNGELEAQADSNAPTVARAAMSEYGFIVDTPFVVRVTRFILHEPDIDTFL
jgi:hypothetical protein